MESIERPRWIDSRVGRALLFVAVVWTVAGSYIAIQIALEQGLDFALSHPSESSDFALATATRTSLTCSVDRGDNTPTATPDDRLTAWMLGMKVGRDAIARQYSSVDPNTLSAGRKDIQTLANMAGVPAPSPFAPAHAVSANTDFLAYLESEANTTSRALARSHAPEACHLFKLAALWGYATMVRPALPGERNIFSAEIRHHADGLLPPELWNAMAQPTSSSASADAIFRGDAATTQRIIAYLSTPR
jgi:hypothetical protein